MNTNINYIIHNGILKQELPENNEVTYENYSIIYEVFRVEDRISLFLEEHVLRLTNSLSRLNLTMPFTYEEISNQINVLVAKNKIRNGNIKISCYCSKICVESYRVEFIASYYPTFQMYSNGVPTILLHAERKNPNVKIANTKTRTAANNELEKTHMFEALLVNHDDYITEGSRTNVFFISDNKIITAPEHMILPGIMRSKVIEIIKLFGFELITTTLHMAMLQKVDAVFLTGTSPRILPVNSIDDLTYDVNHKLLRTLMNSLNNFIEDYKNKKPEFD